jgi:hypothetical protein
MLTFFTRCADIVVGVITLALVVTFTPSIARSGFYCSPGGGFAGTCTYPCCKTTNTICNCCAVGTTTKAGCVACDPSWDCCCCIPRNEGGGAYKCWWRATID